MQYQDINLPRIKGRHNLESDIQYFQFSSSPHLQISQYILIYYSQEYPPQKTAAILSSFSKEVMETKKQISEELHKERKKEEQLRKPSRPKIAKNSTLMKNLSLDEQRSKSSEKGLEDFLDEAAQDMKHKKRRRSKKLMMQFESFDISTL